MKIELKPVPCDMDPRALSRMEGIKDCEAVIDGFRRTWEIYVPTSYDKDVPMPLVLDLHGGSNHSSSWARPWAHVGEREGFIVLYPHCVVNGVTWNVFHDVDESQGYPNDVTYIDEILKRTFEEYNIDRTRMYIHGQSMGDMMTTTYIKERGYLFAAAAPMSGPAGPVHHLNPDGSWKEPVCELPVTRTHGSQDMAIPVGTFKARDPELFKNQEPFKGLSRMGNRPKRPMQPVTEQSRKDKMEVHQLVNNGLWLDKNKCTEYPELYLNGVYAVAVYKGEQCDFNFLMVEGGGHNPHHGVHDALWTYFFSGWRRIDGKCVRVEPRHTFTPDRGAIALANGAIKAYVDNKLVDIGGTSECINGVWYVPVTFLEKVFPGVRVEVYGYTEDGCCARITRGEDELQLASGILSGLYNQEFRGMERVLYKDGQMLVPIADIAAILGNLKCSTGREVAYIGPNAGEIGYDFAYIIRALLGTQRTPTHLELLEREQQLIKEGSR